MFPNPASDQVIVTSAEGAPLSLVLWDHVGRMITTHFRTATSNSVVVDVSDLRAGIYLLQVRTASSMSVLRLMVE